MIAAENALLKSVRAILRETLRMTDTNCEIEPDDNIPAIAGDEYVAIVPGGMVPGPRHNSSGGIWDTLFSFRVVVYHRMAHIPRDRRRNVFLDRSTGLNARLNEAMAVLDFSNALIAEATAELNRNTPTGQFVEPARFASVDAQPRLITFETYDAERVNVNPVNPIVAMARGASFQGCRFIAGR